MQILNNADFPRHWNADKVGEYMYRGILGILYTYFAVFMYLGLLQI